MATSPRRWASVLGLVLAACGAPDEQPPPDAAPPTDAAPPPDAPPPPPDGDLDGVADADDCAPTDARAYQMLAYGFRDHDGDGRYIAQVGSVCTAATLPPGYRADVPTEDIDCDDADATRWRTAEAWADADADGVGVAPATALCIGADLPAGWAASGEDCAPADGDRWRPLAYGHRDDDGDGAWIAEAGELCAGAALPAGYRADDPGGEPDCAAGDPTRWRLQTLYPDADGDHVGVSPSLAVCVGAAVPAGWATTAGDCAATDAGAWQWLAYGYRDRDGDGVTVVEPGELCAGASLPAGYRTMANGADCDDDDDDRWRTVALYADDDGDGVGAGDAVSTCLGATLPAGSSETGTDCAAGDPARWGLLPYGFVDGDGDGATVVATGSACSGATLPPPYRTTAAGLDCDDDDPNLTRWVLTYPDLDGDGVGAAPRSIQCLGASLPPGRRLGGYDEDDADPAVITTEDSDDDELDLILLD